MSQLIHSLSSASSAQAPSRTASPVGRPDSATAQTIQVSLVLNSMLGQSAANAYLARHAVDARIAERVLGEGKHRSTDDADVPVDASR